MSNYVTANELSALSTHMDQRFDELLDITQTFMKQVDERFNKLESSIDRLINTLDGFLKRLDDLEAEQVARDRQFDRLVEWAHKVSEKTGIPLENL